MVYVIITTYEMFLFHSYEPNGLPYAPILPITNVLNKNLLPTLYGF